MKRILLFALLIFSGLKAASGQTCSGSFYIENYLTPVNPTYCLTQQVNLQVTGSCSSSTVTWSISANQEGPFTPLGTSNYNSFQCTASFGFTPAEAGTYWLKASRENVPCEWPPKQFTVANAPLPAKPILTSSTICPNVVLSISEPDPQYTIQWYETAYSNTTAISGQNGVSLTRNPNNQSGTFTAAYTNSAGCRGAYGSSVTFGTYGIAPIYPTTTTSEFYFTKYAGSGAYEVKDDCNKLFAKFQGEGGGSFPTYRVKGKVTIDGSMNSYLGRPYLNRHYDFTPAPNGTYPATPTRYQVSLFFTQQEFDAFNAATSSETPKLPREPNGNWGYFNDNGYFINTGPSGGIIYYGHTKLRIIQGHGEPSVSGGGPETYTSEETLNGCQLEGSCDGLLNVTTYWNTSYNLWEVKITNLTSFSGFFVTTENATPLPVALLSFKARKLENTIVLNWQTTEETNSDHFEIQRSSDAKQWTGIGVVEARGESKGLAAYSFTDNMISSLSLSPFSSTTYYRLKMMDRDATFAYSRIAPVSMDGISGINVFPNPAGREINFTGSVPVKGYKILNSAGRSISEKQISETVHGKISLPLLPAGFYNLELYDTGGYKHLRKVVIAP